jgi:hypothetical protein
MLFVNGFVNGAQPVSGQSRCVGRAAGRLIDYDGGERAADDQLGERVRDLAVGLQVGLDVLLHRERYVSVAEPYAECLQSILASRPAVA